MTVAGSLHKLVWGGRLCTTESWSCSLHLLTPTPEDVPFAPVVAALTTFQSSVLQSKAAFLDFVKINRIVPETGKYFDTTGARTFFLPVPAKGTGNEIAPPQVTVAISLTTINSRGLAHRGRFYAPTANVAVDLNGKHPNAATWGLLTKTLLNAITATGAAPVVFSMKGQIVNLITGIAVGDVVDTQTRRRKNLIEAYTAQVLP